MESHGSLPYIDADISEAQRAAADVLIRRELPRDHNTTIHSSIAHPPTSRLTLALQQEVDRVVAGKQMTGGIDTSRYEPSEDLSADSNVEPVKAALRSTYANMTYLRDRQTNIALLEEYGKNAWLIGNSHLDDIQKRLDSELASLKTQTEDTNRKRKAAQEDSKGELLGLEETWKQGISRIIETQLATDQLQQQLNQKRHAPAA
ncbi:hypothetical protein PMZ80_005359 [Knufia obscura]|uniref:Pre-mRNA-splicing factor SPF27 n=2 Tax=Knufia TaxID=430999 RepID=A0AAN8ISB9_9EURO|nr:hypothetical protein PMZ80_005359 [Knufia obscura]KAK5958027.1 hypothetical protein OHC33_001217 [Knufia fluminis]